VSTEDEENPKFERNDNIYVRDEFQYSGFNFNELSNRYQAIPCEDHED
jgi:hypothetical protein